MDAVDCQRRRGKNGELNIAFNIQFFAKGVAHLRSDFFSVLVPIDEGRQDKNRCHKNDGYGCDAYKKFFQLLGSFRVVIGVTEIVGLWLLDGSAINRQPKGSYSCLGAQLDSSDILAEIYVCSVQCLGLS